VKGAVKEGVGKMTDNHSQEAEGKLEKNAGKAERKVGAGATPRARIPPSEEDVP
jgi:uncharacterized protein YjbJ (UPF0337 family)